jgi:hypothetical protein
MASTSGKPAAKRPAKRVAGHIGKGDAFGEAIADFAVDCTQQNECDRATQEPMKKAEPAASGPVSFNRQGPFYRLQLKLGLLSQTDLAAPRRALIFAALAWATALLLAFAQGFALNEVHERAFLFDFRVYAIAIAIIAFVLMEKTSDRRMALLYNQFVAHDLMPPSSYGRYQSARQAVQRRSGSALVEGLLLIGAYWLTYVWLKRAAMRIDGGTWVGHVEQGSLVPTLAGWWALLVMTPLFLFLMGRWLWRFVVWGRLLRDLAKCELRLVATHPDGSGGIAFISQYPKTYVLFVFALSTVVSSGVLMHVVYSGASLLTFKFAALGLILFVVVFFVLPLTAFSPVLKKLKRRGLSLYGALITRHNLAFEAKWCGSASAGPAEKAEQALGSPDVSSLADIAASYEQVKKIKALPVSKESILPLLAAAVLPMAAVAATQAPFKEIVHAVKGMLLI